MTQSEATALTFVAPSQKGGFNVNPIVISFGETLRLVNLEELLSRNYARTLKEPKVTFNFRQTRYIELFAQSLLFVWARRIVAAKRVLTVVAPADHAKQAKDPQSVLRFINLWRVWDGYRRVGAHFEDPLAGSAPAFAERKNGVLTQYYPFSFYAEEGEWDSFLKSLEDETKLNSMFPDGTAKLAVVGGGGLRSIILEEIGKNAFEHGGGTAAHVSIGRWAGFEVGSDANLEQRLRSSPGFATRFLRNLGGQECLEIIISDAGPGIPSKLRKSYLDDRIIENKKARPNDADLIEYAFLLHSSSKTDSWYAGSAESKMGYVLPRGLYFVKNIARRNRALLVCRSGAGYFVCDFLSSTAGEFHSRLLPSARWPLADLGGVQIQMLIPKSPGTVRRNDFATALGGSSTAPVIRMVPVGGLMMSAKSNRAKTIARALTTGAHRAILSAAPGEIVIFDFIGTRWAKDTKDKLYPLIWDLSHLALNHQMIGVVHTSHIDAVIDEMFAPLAGKTKLASYLARPFLHLSLNEGKLAIDLRGPSYQETRASFQKLLVEGPQGSVPEFLDHLLTFDDEGDPIFRFSQRDLEQHLAKYRAGLLARIMSDPAYGIFHKGKFILPTGPYAENFYEVGALLESDEGRELVREGLLSLLHESDFKDALLVCLSSVGCEMGRLLSTTPLFLNRKGAIVYAPERTDFVDFPLPPGFTGRIVFLVDVIVTGSSLGLAARILARRVPADRLSAIAVLDRRGDAAVRDWFNFEGLAIALSSLYRIPSLLSPAKPPSWSFADIRRIDEAKWRPMPDSDTSDELWTCKEFLSGICARSDGLRLGHYVSSRGNHYKYFVLTRHIAATFSDMIVEKLRERVNTIIEKAQVPGITHILVPRTSVGIDLIAQRFGELHGGARLLAIDPDVGFERPPATISGTTAVLVLDSASSSNQTAFALLDAASKLRPKVIIGCIMMSRTPESNWRILSHITGYSNSEVSISALVRVGLPVYQSQDDCPLCKRLRQLRHLRTSKRYPLLEAHFTREIDRLEPQDVKGLTENPGSYTQSQREELGQLAYFRATLDNASHEGLGALGWVSSILKGKTAGERRSREALLVACGSEAALLRSARLKLPADVLALFGVAAEQVALSSADLEVQRAALEVLFVVAPDQFQTMACNFAAQHGMMPRNIQLLLCEMLLQSHGDPAREVSSIARSLRAIYAHVEESPQRKLVDGSIRTLILSVIRGLDYETNRITAQSHRFDANVEFLLALLTDHRGGTHPFIGQSMMNLNYVANVTSAQSTFDYCFLPEGCFADQVFRELLPRLGAIEGAFDALGRERFSYLSQHVAPSLKTDLFLLNTSVLTIDQGIKKGEMTEASFLEIYYGDDVAAARSRLSKWLGKESSQLIAVLRSMVCNVKKLVASCCDMLRPTLQTRKILLNLELATEELVCYVHPEIVMNVTTNLIENCYKYAFPTERIGGGAAVQVRLQGEGEFVTLDVVDNGNGKVGVTDVGLGRVRVIVEPFGGSADSIDQPTGVHIRVKWLKKEIT